MLGQALTLTVLLLLNGTQGQGKGPGLAWGGATAHGEVSTQSLQTELLTWSPGSVTQAAPNRSGQAGSGFGEVLRSSLAVPVSSPGSLRQGDWFTLTSVYLLRGVGIVSFLLAVKTEGMP